tara:strand:- start:3419 stop:3703 length:285 start_codon:yes stop_codon:yes gene_type:complete
MKYRKLLGKKNSLVSYESKEEMIKELRNLSFIELENQPLENLDDNTFLVYLRIISKEYNNSLTIRSGLSVVIESDTKLKFLKVLYSKVLEESGI